MADLLTALVQAFIVVLPILLLVRWAQRKRGAGISPAARESLSDVGLGLLFWLVVVGVLLVGVLLVAVTAQRYYPA